MNPNCRQINQTTEPEMQTELWTTYKLNLTCRHYEPLNQTHGHFTLDKYIYTDLSKVKCLCVWFSGSYCLLVRFSLYIILVHNSVCISGSVVWGIGSFVCSLGSFCLDCKFSYSTWLIH